MLKLLLSITLLSSIVQPSFLHIGIDEGLSQLSVQTIEEDSNGFIWVGTGDGLNKFEGTRITTYRHAYQDSTSVIDDDILKIESTVDGSVLVCTRKGVSMYVPETDKFKTIKGAEGIQRCFDLRKWPCFPKNNPQWMLTAKGSVLSILNPETGKRDTLTTNLNVSNLIVKDSSLFILTSNAHIYRLRNLSEDMESIFCSDLNNTTACDLAIGDDGTFWIALFNKGIISYNPSDSTTRHYTDKNGLSSNNIRAIEIDDKGIVWIASGNNLSLLNPEDGSVTICSHNHKRPESLSASSLKAICKSSSGVMWIGTFYRGLDYYNPDMLSFHSTVLPESYWNSSEAIICTVSADNDGYIWIGTSRSGIFRYHPETSSFIPFRKSPSGEEALNAVAYHNNGKTVLFGCSYSGLSIYDKDKDKIIWKGKPESIYSISSHSNGTYLLGGQHGLKIFRFEDMTLKNVIMPGLPNSRVYYTLTDSDGIIWVGMEDNLICGYLTEYEDGNFILNILETHNDIRQVQDMIEEGDKIWFASRSGLFRYDKTTGMWSVINSKDGVSTNLVRGLELDDNGYLWAATDRSILLVDSKSLTFQEYHTNDGLINEKYNIYANSKSADGTIWFGGTSGITYFRPNIKQVHSKISKPFISALYVNGERCLPGFSSLLSKPIYDTRRIALEANQNNVAFTLSNIEVFSKDRIEYMMEGIDKEWQKLSPKSDIVSYANLPAGENVFKIRSANILQNEYSEISHLTIHVKSPWYQSTAFIIIVCLLVLVGVSFSIYHVKHRSSHQIAEILNKAQIDIRTAKVSSYMTIQSMNRTKDVDFMTQALKVMEENISNDKFNIDIFAEQMNMSRSNLHLRIKTAYGASATHFIRRIRIEKAMEYLKEGELNISEIAYSVGFSSATYFATAFKQVTGVNPTEWKLSLRQDSIK